MAKVNRKDTDYYKSGQHLQNVLKAARKGFEVQQAKKQKRIEDYFLNPSLCIVCNHVLDYKKKKNKFCSNSCAAIFNNQKRKENGYIVSDKLKERLAKKAKEHYNNLSLQEKELRNQKLISVSPNKKHDDVTLKCNQCSKEFQVPYISRHRKTCSEDCRIQASVGVRTYQNGSRKPVKFYNPYEDKIVLLESSWEVKIANLLIEKNIRWIRPKFIKWQDSTGKTRRYFPDFYLPELDVYLDPKNPYCMKQDQEKMFEVTKQVKVIYGSVGNIKEYILSVG